MREYIKFVFSFLVFSALSLCVFAVTSRTARADSFEDYTLQQVSQCEGFYVDHVNVTQTNTKVTRARDTKAIYVENIGANEVYWDPDDGVAVADTSHSKLEPGDNRALVGYKTRAIGFIASTGETSTILLETCR